MRRRLLYLLLPIIAASPFYASWAQSHPVPPVAPVTDATWRSATAAAGATTSTSPPVASTASTPVAVSVPLVASSGSGSLPSGVGTYALDATTTDTADWSCIRKWEGGGGYTDFSGAYGFQGGDYSAMPPAQQDALALAIFGRNGDHFDGAWNGSPQKCGLY